MRICPLSWRWSIVWIALCVGGPALVPAGSRAEEPAPGMTVVVMDPLAAPLSCDCVKGHAQRRYEVLAAFLEKRLKQPVRVVFSEDLRRALRGEAGGRAHLVIGKRSVVEFDAAECKLPVRPLAMLTGKDGSTTVTGLFVVPTADKARRLADLKGYKIHFGEAASAEKHAAALEALRAAGVAAPKDLLTSSACSDGAVAALDNKDPPGAAAVISSYAMALLEGCGTIEPGSLRVIGETRPVPFVAAFTTVLVTKEQEKPLLDALLAVRDHKEILAALETKNGFVPLKAEKPAATGDWPGFRGPKRDGLVASLPASLPARQSLEKKTLWRQDLPGGGLAGLAATAKHVIVPDRNPEDSGDVFHCLDAVTGEERWRIEYPAVGRLDYGNQPRATPTIHDGLVYLLGAMGDLHCVALDDGRVVWKRNLGRDFGGKLTTWGWCSSPLVVDDKVLVNPGGKDASIAALDRRTGKTVWTTPGDVAAYASLIVGEFGGVRQAVGYDAVALCGWDVGTGRRLWQLVPPEKGDFNVPTPVDLGGKLLVTTENNGTRIYAFDDSGKIVPKPIAENSDLAGSMTTPVVIDGRVFGCSEKLVCLDLAGGLKTLWEGQDPALGDYVSLIAAPGRLLAASNRGELLLIGARGDRFEVQSRVFVAGEESDSYSHPALVGDRLYVRNHDGVACILLGAN